MNLSDEIIHQTALWAMVHKLFVGSDGRTSMGSGVWHEPIEVHKDEKQIALRNAAHYQAVHLVTFTEWQFRVANYGLWEKVGMWQFERWPCPWAANIRSCNSIPQTMGRILYDLDKQRDDLAAPWKEKLEIAKSMSDIADSVISSLHPATEVTIEHTFPDPYTTRYTITVRK